VTVAVCFRCGALKSGALDSCRICGATPGREDIAWALTMTDHYFDRETLVEMGNSIAGGNLPPFDRQLREYFLDAVRVIPDPLVGGPQKKEPTGVDALGDSPWELPPGQFDRPYIIIHPRTTFRDLIYCSGFETWDCMEQEEQDKIHAHYLSEYPFLPFTESDDQGGWNDSLWAPRAGGKPVKRVDERYIRVLWAQDAFEWLAGPMALRLHDPVLDSISASLRKHGNSSTILAPRTIPVEVDLAMIRCYTGRGDKWARSSSRDSTEWKLLSGKLRGNGKLALTVALWGLAGWAFWWLISWVIGT